MVKHNEMKDIQFGVIKYATPSSEAVMGLTSVGQLMPVPYRYSAAGSNPREFQGMKSGTNRKILESLLQNREIFWALHSGVTVTVTAGDASGGSLEYEDACLTNGLQTITIARILAMIKAYQLESQRSEIHTKINRGMMERWWECMQRTFTPDVADQLEGIKIEHVNSVLNWLTANQHSDVRTKFKEMSLDDLLNTRVSMKVVLLDPLVSSSEPSGEKAHALETLGYNIAEANNDTQKVEAGDLFGSQNERWLEEHIFGKIERPYKVEYRRFAEDRSKSDQKIVHVLELLRAILPTTLVIDSDAEDVASFVAGYANRRDPIYNWFEKKIIHRHANHQSHVLETAIEIIRNLMPDMLEMMSAVQSDWEKQRREVSFNMVSKWVSLKQVPPALKAQIFEDAKWLKPSDDADTVLRKYLGFSFANFFTIFVFATRNAIRVGAKNKVDYKLEPSVISEMVQNVYQSLSKERLKSFAIGSTSELFRNPELYSSASTTFELIARLKSLDLAESVSDYRVLI
jgi:hypothetical protein